MSDKARLLFVGVDDASETPEPLPRRRPAAGPPPEPASGLPARLPPFDFAPPPGLASGLPARVPQPDSGPPAETANGQLPRLPHR